MVKYRLRYCKEAGLRFVSHLDLLKIFSRAARRCQLPLSYSQGFNPHPELVFNAPLPLGVTSESEFVDLSLDEELEPHDCMERLAAVLPVGIRPVSIRKLEPGAPTVMKYVCACEYSMQISVSGVSVDAYLEGVRRVLEADNPILIMKKSKSGIKETDIRPMIRSFFEDCKEEGEKLTFLCVTAAGNEVNLRPEAALSGLTEAAFGQAVDVRVLGIHKKRYFTVDGGNPD